MAHRHDGHDPSQSAKDGRGHDAHGHHDHAHGHGHGHAHAHGHGHGHGHVHAPANFGAAFAIGISLNVAYVVAEGAWGVLAHAMALLADAGHNLSDILGLVGAWLARRLATRAPSPRFTYGLRRSTILSALGNAAILLVVTGGIVWESAIRLFDPGPVAGRTVMIVAAIGIVANGFTALLFARGSRDDINLRGVFIHMVADALMALCVVISGLAIMLTGWRVLDPIVSIAVSGVVIAGTWSLLRDSLDLALDAVPPGLDEPTVARALRDMPGISDIHHLHIWAMSTTETALTAHLVYAPLKAAEARDALLRDACAMLRERFRIAHATLQFESAPCAVSHGMACAPSGHHDHG